MAYEFDRRRALSLVGAGAATGLAASPGLSLARTAARRGAVPWLYSPDQLQGELWLLRLIQDPAVGAIQAKIGWPKPSLTRRAMRAPARLARADLSSSFGRRKG